ncbi:MAG: PQQ-binding-like beta-propeller repeat protein, partial [Candidatus Aenigmarchaeota archaeon]|nr:PQQ-binding-like beta-propeller repeat protein [Candidatus Aenigmarchaeota archaeon]
MSSTIMVGKNIVFGAFDNFVYALDPENGKTVWKFRTNGPVYSTPAFDGNRIYAGSADGLVYALDVDGNLIWKFNSSSSIMNSSIVCSDGMVFFGNDSGYFYCLNDNGGLIWKFLTGGSVRTMPVRTMPAILKDRVIFGSHDHNLYCLDRNGNKLWKFLTGGPIWTQPCLVDNDGKLLWSFGKRQVSDESEFLVYFGGFDGGVYCLNDAGRFQWKCHTNGINSSGPEFENCILYFGSSNGYFYKVDASEGRILLKLKTMEIGHSTPTIRGNEVFFCDYVSGNDSFSGGGINCISKEGEALWRFETHGPAVSTPLAVKNMLYAGSFDGFMYAIDVKRRRLDWKFRTLYEKANFDYRSFASHAKEQEEKAGRILSVWHAEAKDPKGPRGHY